MGVFARTGLFEPQFSYIDCSAVASVYAFGFWVGSSVLAAGIVWSVCFLGRIWLGFFFVCALVFCFSNGPSVRAKTTIHKTQSPTYTAVYTATDTFALTIYFDKYLNIHCLCCVTYCFVWVILL